MNWRLLTSDKLDALPIPQQFLSMADAYLDSALRLCTVLIRSTRTASYERGVVVLYLTHHSLELFLKGMIRMREPEERFAHDLEHLSNRYHSIYREKSFAIEMPFTVVSDGRSAEARALVQRLVRSRTERLRYPIDKAGKPWGGSHGFEAGSFKKSLLTLQDSYARIRRAIAV